jgi:hypothetical protein
MRIATLLLFTIVIMLSSCEKVIEFPLNTTEKRVVLQAFLTDTAGVNNVKITTTADFSAPNRFIPITGAQVTVTDNLNNSVTFTQRADSTYGNTNFRGVPGRTYTMKIVTGGKEYTAVSILPLRRVAIDSLTVSETVNPGNATPTKNIDCYFTDPINVKNYYRFVFSRNSRNARDIEIDEDQFYDGQPNTYTLSSDSLKRNDIVVIEMQCIDKAAFNYFFTLQSLTNDESAAPANPNSNWNNGALGYFSAYTYNRRRIVVP